MGDKLEITIIQEDFKESIAFYHSQGCPLYCALRRKFPYMDYLVVYKNEARMQKREGNMWNSLYIYSIPKQWGEIGNSKYSPPRIEEMIIRAKRGEEVEEVHLTLELLSF